MQFWVPYLLAPSVDCVPLKVSWLRGCAALRAGHRLRGTSQSTLGGLISVLCYFGSFALCCLRTCHLRRMVRALRKPACDRCKHPTVGGRVRGNCFFFAPGLCSGSRTGSSWRRSPTVASDVSVTPGDRAPLPGVAVFLRPLQLGTQH
jgi:hypothetical protein